MNFTDLAAVCIHDVKNRLALLAARAEAQGDGATLHGVLDAAATLNSLLACYKAESGRLGVDIGACAPSDLVAELAAETGKFSPVAVDSDCSAAPVLWFYDEQLVRMALAGAACNALRFARHRIALSVRAAGDWLEFTVRDDGDGYPAAVLAEVAAVAPLSRHGTGLGLYFARLVAALHHNDGRRGSLAIANAGGAVFTLRLPR